MTFEAAHVASHLGYGYGPFAEAHLGLLWDEVAAPLVVVPKKKKKSKSTTNSADTGSGSTASAAPWLVVSEQPVFELTETALENLAERITEFAQTPELQTWTSSVLSAAGRKGVNLSTEASLARTLLQEVQRADFPLVDRTSRALYLTAGLVAIGLPSALAAHGEVVLSRALSVVHVDGAWVYADPNSPLELGQHAPFLREKIISIPDLPRPEIEEVRKYKVQIEALKAQLAASQQLALSLANQILTEVRAPTSVKIVYVVQRDPNEWIYKAVAVGAVTLLALALWELHKARRESS